jgi:hypothetical protein
MDNLIIFFDNITFKINNVLINYLKRLIVNDIIHNKILNEKINDIYILKTRPNLIEVKLNDKDDFDINKLLITLNNVIYKNYDSYGSLCFKTILDRIKEFEKNTKKNKIIIICSIDSPNSFTESNKKYIRESFNSFGSEIKLINISNYSFLNQICPNIKEYFLDIREFKIENLKVNEIFNIDENFSEINKKYFDENIKNLENLELINLDNKNELLNYLIFLNYSEKKILENLIKKNINNDNDYSNFELIKKIILINFKSENNIIKNIFKAFQNIIYNQICRLSNSIYKLPTNQLSSYLSNSYIKYILEFYEIIYPKIYKNNYLSSISANNLVKKKQHISLTSKIDIAILPNMVIKQNDNSIEFLKSTLSLTNWIEEYNNLNPFGFLIKYSPNKLSYKGILDLNSSIYKTYPNMVINTITTNWVGIYDYYQIILSEYEENPNGYDNINKEIFNISNFNITDNIQGDGNVLLPVYINQNHWNLVKSIWTYHLSFVNNCFEPEYNKKMDNIYFLTFLKIFTNLKNIDKNTNAKSTIILFCYLLRTCMQILIDNKFLHSIKKDYPKYFQLLLNTENFTQNTNFSDWIIRLLQLIISNGCEQEQLENDLNLLNQYIFNKFIVSNYKMDYWEMINDPNTPVEKINQELNVMKNHVLQDNISWLFLNHDIKIINKIIKSIYSIKGFNQFIKIFDASNGMVDLNPSTNSIDIFTISKIIQDKFSEQFNIEKYNVDVSKFYTNNI